MVKRAVLMLLGSIAVSAACAAAREGDGPVTHAIDAARDALGLDTAVSDARADGPPPPTPLPPMVIDVPCDVVVKPFLYAERAFPGRTDVELGRGNAIVCGAAGGPPGYCSASTLYVKDGSVMALCGAVDSWKATSVRIVMPVTP